MSKEILWRSLTADGEKAGDSSAVKSEPPRVQIPPPALLR